MFDYLSFALLMLVGQLSPGPDMLLILKNSFNHDLRAALFTIAGIVSGILIHTTIALSGLAFVFARSGPAYMILRYGGAIYLAYLGTRLLLGLRKKPARPGDTGTAVADKLSDGGAFTQGFLTNLLNPKVIVIISSILLMFLGSDSSPSERITYGAILILEGLVVWILFALLLQTPAARRQFLRWQAPINGCFGLLLLALAVRALA